MSTLPLFFSCAFMVELCFPQMCADPQHMFYLFRFSTVRTDPEQSWLRLDNDQFVLIGQWKLMALLLFPASGFIQQSHWDTSMYFKSLSMFLNWVWLFFRANIDFFPPNQLSTAHLWQTMSLLKQEMNTLMCKYSQSKLIWANTARWHFVLQPNGCWQWLGGNPFCKLHGENISKSRRNLGSPAQPFHHQQQDMTLGLKYPEKLRWKEGYGVHLQRKACSWWLPHTDKSVVQIRGVYLFISCLCMHFG